jgi:hypothetical protein
LRRRLEAATSAAVQIRTATGGAGSVALRGGLGGGLGRPRAQLEIRRRGPATSACVPRSNGCRGFRGWLPLGPHPSSGDFQRVLGRVWSGGVGPEGKGAERDHAQRRRQSRRGETGEAARGRKKRLTGRDQRSVGERGEKASAARAGERRGAGRRARSGSERGERARGGEWRAGLGQGSGLLSSIPFPFLCSLL